MSYNLKHLSLLTTLLLTSSMVYAGWITKGTDYKGDCLEMMCDCVEDSETRDGYCCPNGTAFANTGNPHPTYTPCKCPEDQEWDDATSKCIEIKCPEGWYKDKGLCCPYGQVNYQGVCTCENPVNKCGNACCNGVGEKCMDPENSICCATQLCGGECCATGAQCIEDKCVNLCPEGEKLVDYYDKSGVKKQTCCAENLHGADWDGNCCPEPAICDTTKECCVLDNINLDICGKPTKKTAQKITQKIGRLINGNCQEVEETYCPLIQEPPKGECSLCSQKVNSVILNKSTPGKVSVSVCDGRYRVTMTGGGGGSKMVSHSGKWGTRRCGGGSGGYFDGVLKLSKGDYTVVVGSGGERNYSGTATTAFGLTCSGGTSGNPGSGGGFSKQTAVQIIETYKSGRGNVGHCKQKRGKSGDTTAHGGASGITNTTSGAGAGGSGSYWGYNPGYSGLVKIQYLGP